QDSVVFRCLSWPWSPAQDLSWLSVPKGAARGSAIRTIVPIKRDAFATGRADPDAGGGLFLRRFAGQVVDSEGRQNPDRSRGIILRDEQANHARSEGTKQLIAHFAVEHDLNAFFRQAIAGEPGFDRPAELADLD